MENRSPQRAANGSPQSKSKVQPPGNSPSTEPLSPQLIVKLERLRVGVRELPATFKQSFEVPQEQIDEDKVMLFELFNMSPLEGLFNEVKQMFTKELIDQNKSCTASERSEFYEVLCSQLLPWLTISKFDLSHLCLVGFDIYVGPYEAILDIINRLTRFAGQLQADAKLPAVKSIIEAGKPVKLLAIRQGYPYFRFFSTCFHLDINLYMLGEYLKKATKALDRRAKEIIFTGCYSLFEQLLPVSVELQLHGLLAAAADANVELLQSHPSYDYFLFFTKVPIQPRFEYLFESIRAVLNKSLLTFTLTPFMFGVLRNYELFRKFLQTIDHQCWVKFAKVLVQGLVIVIKSGSLRFSEVTDLLELAICSTYLGNEIYQTAIDSLSKPNGPEWHEVDSFFRSAIKAGYSTGFYAAMHKLEDEDIETRLRNSLIVGLISLKDSSDQRLVQQWLTTVQVKRELQEQLLNSLLDKQLKLLDSDFNLLGIGSASRSYRQPESLKKVPKRQLNLTIVRVLNLLRMLHQCCQKNYLEVEAFREYLLTVITVLFEASQAPACQQLAEYVLLAGPNNHQTFLANISTIEKLPLSEGFLAAYLKRTASEPNKEDSTKDLIEYIIMCLKKAPLTNETLAHLERTFFSPLVAQNKKYLKYNFGNVPVADIPTALAHSTSFYSQGELARIIESLYTVDTATNALVLNPITVVDVTEQLIIKTLNEDVVTDLLFVELTLPVQQLLSALLESLLAGYPRQSGNGTADRCLNLLAYLSLKYPIVDYYVLNYSVPTGNIKQFLEEGSLPDYMHFGLVLTKIGRVDSVCLSFLLRLLMNKALLTRQGQPLIGKLVVPNIVGMLARSIKESSRNANKQRCLQELSILEAVLADHAADKTAKSAASGALSVLRTIAKDCQAGQVLQLLTLFDRFVRILVGSDFALMEEQIRRENLRYVFEKQTMSVPNVEFPHCEVVVLSQQPDKASKERYESFLKKESSWRELPPHTIEISRLNLVVKAEKDRSPTKSHPPESSRVHDYNELEDILAGELPLSQQEQPNHPYSGYRYPDLSFKQICIVVERHFFTEDNILNAALLNYQNNATVVVFLVGLYLYGADSYRNSINLKDLAKDAVSVKALSVLLTIGFVKVLNMKIKELSNIPAELRVFNQSGSNDSSLLNLLLKKLLQEPSKELIGEFLSRLLPQQVIDSSQQYLYNTYLDNEVINLIQRMLPVTGVMHLSPLVHSNPETLRSYFSSLVEGMSIMNLPSRLLNYHEYIKLTGEWQSDKEFLQLFEIYRLNWQFYRKVVAERQVVSRREAQLGLQYKLSAARPKQQIVGEYRNEIETNDANMLSKMTELVSKANLADALRRHSDLYNTLKKMQQKQLITSEEIRQFDIIHIFKQLCKLFNSGVLVSNFIVHNREGSLQLAHSDLPKFVEFWEEAVGQTAAQEILKVTTVKQPAEVVRVSLSKVVDLPSPASFPDRRYEITIDGKPQQEHTLWRKQLEDMRNSNLVVNTSGLITFQPCSDDQLREFRLLGALYGCLLAKNTLCSDRFTRELVHYIRRERLPWTLVQATDKEAYNTITDLLSRESIRDMNLTFTYNKEQLVPRGSDKRVTDFNRREYCNLLAISRLPPIRPQAQHFLNGLASTVALDRLPNHLLPQ